jgi:hypothetical protein
MSIKITDIFGIGVNNNNTFNKNYIIIDISADNIDLILQPINQYNGVTIYKYIPSELFKKYCKSIDLDINNYINLGDYIIYDINDIKIVLAHKKNILVTNRYVLIDTIGQLYIWKPYSINRNYTNLGVVCIDEPNVVPTEYVGMVPHDHVKIFEPSYNELFQNDYNLLGTKKNGRRKLISMNIIYSVESSIDENIDESVDININKNINKHTDNNNNNNIDRWSKYNGKYFKLKQSSNPWYIDKPQLVKSKNINNNNFFRKNKENFNDTINDIINDKNVIEKDKLNYIILTLLILIICLYFYNKYYKKNNNEKTSEKKSFII